MKERILKAIDALEAQGDYGVNPDTEYCMYLTPEGNRCIVGHMLDLTGLSKEEITMMPSVGFVIAHSGGPQPLPTQSHKLMDLLGWPKSAELNLLNFLQDVHDEGAFNNTPLSEACAYMRKYVKERYAD